MEAEYWPQEEGYGYPYPPEDEAYSRSQPTTYEEAFSLGLEAVRASHLSMHVNRDGRYAGRYQLEGGYAPDSTDSTDAGMSAYSARNRGLRRHSHSRRPPRSTQTHIAQLEQEREQILRHSEKLEHLKQNYVNQLTKALHDEKKVSPQSPEFQEVIRTVKHIVQDMYTRIGTPNDVKLREQRWREKLLEIDEQLKAFTQSRFQPPGSPAISQVSGRDSSPQWSSPPLSHHSDESSLVTDLHPAPHHSLLMQSQNESGFCDNDSDITGSSHHHHHRSKQVHSPNSTGICTTYSSELSGVGPVFSSYHFPRSASVEDTSVHDREGPAEILAALSQNPPIHRTLPTSKYSMASSLSQDTYNDFRQPYHHSPSSISLSQATHPPRSYRQVDHGHYYRKPGSPASSSGTGSMTSSVAHRLGSGPGSTISITTDSSTRSNPKGLLPRPPSLASSSGSATSVMQKAAYPSYGDFSQRSRSETLGYPPFVPSLPTQYDSDTEEGIPAIKSSPMLSREGGMPGRRQSAQREHELREREKDAKLAEAYKRRREAKRMQQLDHPRIPEEGNHRDSFTMKLEMVLSVLSLVLSNKDQTDADAARMLLTLSQTPETCSVMRQSACMSMLIQIVHNIDRKGERSHREVRAKATAALRNIIESTHNTRQGKYEMCVLGVLDKIRGHCDALFEFVHSFPSTRKVDTTERESLQNACDFLIQPVRKLYKYSNEKEHYRPAVLTLGGLQATAELLVVNFRLMMCQKGSQSSEEKPVGHSAKTISVVISILVNLTYGDVHNKSTLCMFPDLLKALMHHLRLKNESIIASGSQVLRNLSWKATADIKDSLLKCDASIILMEALQHVRDEQTVQHITSALWNLSAHSMENRDKICATETGLQQLVELLSYNSPSGTTAVVENVGGILKNLSVVIMQHEEYRKRFRLSGGLGKLVQHLKSKNKTVLANATGTLWNLSARFPEDQKVLWDLGCVPLLDVLQTAHHRNIAEYSRGALRNLLAFGKSNGWTSKSDITAYNIKTQRELSKSLSYAANQVFGHTSNQGKQSNESLQNRKSQTLRNMDTDSTATLEQTRSSCEKITSGDTRGSVRTLRGYDAKDGTSSGDDDYVHMDRSRLKFNRVASVPETMLVQKGDEWSSYMPGPHTPTSKQNLTSQHGCPIDTAVARRKKGTRGAGRSQGITAPRSLSQSESYHLSSTSNSETHSGNGASFCLPAQFTNDATDPASLLAFHDFNPQLEHFSPGHPQAARLPDEYSDLEVEEDEIDIDQPIHGQVDRTGKAGFVDTRAGKSSSNGIERVGSGKGDTSYLALDGLLHGKAREKKVTSV